MYLIMLTVDVYAAADPLLIPDSQPGDPDVRLGEGRNLGELLKSMLLCLCD